jgi:hypothetical protein
MIDIHDAHHAASTWKEFFIHIATIVLGLCIAVSLEQTVEHIHQRRQLAEARAALATERKIDIARFATTTEEFHRFVPLLQNDLTIFVYLKQHPGKPLPPGYGTLRFGSLSTPMRDSAWTAAQRSGVVEYMPQPEARSTSQLYQRLGVLTQRIDDAFAAVAECGRFRNIDPDPRHLSPGQLDHEIDLVSQTLSIYGTIGSLQSNLHRVFADFTPAPSGSDLAAITHTSPSDISKEDGDAMQREIENLHAYERSLDGNEGTQ